MLKRFYLKYIQKIYRGIVSHRTRKKVESFLFDVNKPKLRRKIIRHLSRLPKGIITEEQSEVLDFLRKNPVQVFPYEFTNQYIPDNVEVNFDDQFKLNYVLFEGKKLFFKRSWTKERIQTIYNNLLIEQHPKSPHRYLSKDFDVMDNSIVADIGVADGNFALSVIEKVSKVYLFEPDEEWGEALRATFHPWKEKVVIENKWVSDRDDDVFITMDTYFEGMNPDFIKIDVDGFERKLLDGSKRIMTENDKLRIALCTYHNQEDQDQFKAFFNENGFSTSYSHGYMIFHWGKQKAPYLRRGLIRARKTDA